MDKDIKKMFEEKNRLIIINNLEFDLDRNVDSMKSTVINIFTKEFEVAVKNISSIVEDYDMLIDNDKLEEIVYKYRDLMLNDFSNELIIKRDSLNESIKILDFKEDTMEDYYKFIDNTTNLLKESFKLVSIKENMLTDVILIINVEDMDVYNKMVFRVTEYINIRLFEKLIQKIIDEVNLRDNNLLNKAKESYLKYQEICLNTIHE